ncbi:UNVERIFIED_CONTAM: hypothetical protein H355_008463 [Colinus virginianus]|nr:hypothetical protein H355_008463 [Colinus virginianus]
MSSSTASSAALPASSAWACASPPSPSVKTAAGNGRDASEEYRLPLRPPTTAAAARGTSVIDNLWQYVLGADERRTSLGYDYLVKLLLVGDRAVGKTSLLRRFTRDAYVEDHRATLGVDFDTRTLDVDGKIVKIQLWDTAGHERFRSVTQCTYTLR